MGFIKSLAGSFFSGSKKIARAIGEKTWMSGNLDVSCFRNGDPVPEARSDEEWRKSGEEKQPAWCSYKNDPALGEKYGKLYNWHALNDCRGLAPAGWQIATKEDYWSLAAAVRYDGNALKAKRQGKGAAAGTDSSGFSALLAGHRTAAGDFSNPGIAYFWNSEETSREHAFFMAVREFSAAIHWGDTGKGFGFSVRCVQEQPADTIQSIDASSARQAAVQIGEQTWMAENLNVSRFRNGLPIPEVRSLAEWKRFGEEKRPAWCFFENDPAHGSRHGKLYNWYAARDKNGLAPAGWRMPTDADFKALAAAVGRNGNTLKAVGQGQEGGAGTNGSGFSAFLAGCRNCESERFFGFRGLNYDAHFWSSSECTEGIAFNLSVTHVNNTIYIVGYDMYAGYSVRCIREERG